MVWQVLAASAAAAVLSGVGQAMQQKQAVQEQRRAQRATTAMEAERNKKAAIQTLRQARIQRAAMQVQAENSGAKGSGVAGAVGSIASQAGASIGFQNMQAQGAKNVSLFLDRGARSESKAATFGSAKGTFSDIFSYASQF